MTNRDFDHAIDTLAQRQHGAFNRRQSRAAGGNRDMERRRVEAGTWVALARNVWALAAFPPTWHRQCMAATLAVPGAALCGPAAARLHRVEGFNAVRPEIAVPYTSNVRVPIAQVHRAKDVPTTVVDRIPVTTLAQTCYDLIGRRTLDRIEQGLDGTLLEGRLTIDDLDERVRVLRGTRKPNVAIFEALVEDRRDGPAVADSLLDLALWRLITSRSDLPPFAQQADAPWRDAAPGRVDAFCESRGLVVEVDGRRWHARVADFDRDRWRDAQALARGCRTIRFTYVHLTECPEEVGDMIAAACRWQVGSAA